MKEVVADEQEDGVAASNEEVEDDSNQGVDQEDLNSHGGEGQEDSINLMLGEEDAMFDDSVVNGRSESEKSTRKASDGSKTHQPKSPPRPENAPVVTPFTSKDTLDMGAKRLSKGQSGTDKMSENNSMLVNIDEESTGTQGSNKGDSAKDIDGSNEGKKDEVASGKKEASDKGGGESSGKAAPPSQEKKSAGVSLWVCGLSSTTRATDLKAAFSKHGRVVGAKVVTNARAPGSKCYGFVSLGSDAEAEACIKELNKTELHGKVIYIEKAKSDSSGPPRGSAGGQGAGSSQGGQETSPGPALQGSSSGGGSANSKEESRGERDGGGGRRSRENREERSADRGGRSDRGRPPPTDNSRDTRDLRGRIQANRRSRSPLTRHPRHNPPAHHHGHDRGSHHHHHGPPHHPRDGGRGAGGGHHGGHHGGGNPRDISPRRESKADPSRPGILTFDQIREQQRREKERRRGEEEERRRRAREYERQKEEDRRRREEEQKRRCCFIAHQNHHTHIFALISSKVNFTKLWPALAFS